MDVLMDFGFSSEFTGVYFSSNGSTGMDGNGELTISVSVLSKGETSSNGYFTSDTFYGTGAHEGGHALINALLKHNVSINPDDKNKTSSRAFLERATARDKGKLETAIMKEAKKRYGSNPAISGYGSKNAVEKVAEAVSDVYANKGNAKPYSKTIVDVLKDIKTGKFKPIIRVSKREMGI